MNKKSTNKDGTLLAKANETSSRRFDKETARNIRNPNNSPHANQEPQEPKVKTVTDIAAEAEARPAARETSTRARRNWGEICGNPAAGSAQRRRAAAADGRVGLLRGFPASADRDRDRDRDNPAAPSGTAPAEVEAEDPDQPETPHKQRLARGPLKSRVNQLLDEESVKMFLSSDQLEKVEQQALERGLGSSKSAEKQQMLLVLQRQYSEGTKRRHEQIVRQILQDFDLEKCKEKYRNLYAYEKKPKGRSLADFRFRSELIRLMGTEIIRVSDQSWAGRFQQSLREDYERMLMEKEHQLSRLEQDRQHRLHLESIIGDTGASLTRELKMRMKKASKVNKEAAGSKDPPANKE